MKTSRPATASVTVRSLTPALARPRAGSLPVDARLQVDVHRTLVAGQGALRQECRDGLRAAQKTLPPKYFYDDHGSQLFDAICDLPEYYLTRTEHALAARTSADEIVAIARPARPHRARQRRVAQDAHAARRAERAPAAR